MKYLPRTTIKGQVLANFVAEFTPVPGQEIPNVSTCNRKLIEDTNWWKIYVDRASNAKGAGTGVVIITPDGSVMEQSVQLDFKASNNEAKYEAILTRLNSARMIGK